MIPCECGKPSDRTEQRLLEIGAKVLFVLSNHYCKDYNGTQPRPLILIAMRPDPKCLHDCLLVPSFAAVLQ